MLETLQIRPPKISIEACFALAISLTLLAAQAEVVDRIAVSVGNQVITEAQIVDELRVTSFLDNKPVELTQAQKKAAAERLIEQTLVRREMELSHYPLPGLNEADPLEQELQTKYGSDADFKEALTKAGIAEPDLKQHLWWQLTLLRFIDYRFRPSVQIPEAAIKTYYDKKRAEWEEQGVKPLPSLDDSRADIEKILTEQRVDRAMDRWLGDSRTRIAILYRKEAFE